jgi:hypothetical protein
MKPIELFNEIEKVELSQNNAYEQLLYIFSNFYNILCYYTIPLVKGNELFRSRTNITIDNYNTFRKISYPPVECVKDYSRANRPYQTYFYCSDSLDTNCTELMPYWPISLPVGEIITITSGLWKLNRNLKMLIIPDFKNPKMKDFNLKVEEIGISIEQRQILDFINDKFLITKDINPNIYKITSSFINTLIINCQRNKREIHGIIYTSSQDKNGFNVAFFPDVIDDKLLELKDIKKLFIAKTKHINKPEYLRLPDSISPKKIDFRNEMIIWN